MGKEEDRACEEELEKFKGTLPYHSDLIRNSFRCGFYAGVTHGVRRATQAIHEQFNGAKRQAD